MINNQKNNKGRFEELEEIDEHNIMTRTSINKIKETTIKEMLYSGREIPEQWSKKLDFREIFINLVNKDEDLAKFIKDNECLTSTKNFNYLAKNLDRLLDKSPSLKQIELCRPISGIKKLIENQTFRKESPDSTFCDNESKDTFDESKIISNDNAFNTNNKKFFKKEYLKKTDDFMFLQTPQKKSRESSLFNFQTFKKDNLGFINENIEIIAEEENNEFLLTGMKFNSQKPIKGYHNDYENKNDKSSINKKEKDNLPPLLIKSSSILTQSIRNNLLFGKNETNSDFNSPDVYKKSLRNSINLTKDGFHNNLNALISPGNQNRSISYNTKENENLEENSLSFKKTKQFENKFSYNNKFDTKENLNSNNNITKNSRKILPKIRKKGKELTTHTIIDYSINKSDFIPPDKAYYENTKTVRNDPINTNENINTIGNSRKKLDIKNEKIKDLLEKSKQKGHYAPYFSLCKNCNDRNNEFYNQINLKNAMGIINIINKVEKKGHKFG